MDDYADMAAATYYTITGGVAVGLGICAGISRYTLGTVICAAIAFVAACAFTGGILRERRKKRAHA